MNYNLQEHQWPTSNSLRSSKNVFDYSNAAPAVIGGQSSENEEIPDSGVKETGKVREEVSEALSPEEEMMKMRAEMRRLLGELEASKKDNSRLHGIIREKEREITVVASENEHLREVVIPQLQEEAVTDGMTGLNTKKFFQKSIEEITAQSLRNGEDFSVMMIDLDHFKRVNDTLGHNVGDDVIKLLGKIIDKRFRSADIKCRFGGEEFVVIMPNTFKEQAAQVAEEFREMVATELRLLFDTMGEEGKQQDATASVGISSFSDSREYSKLVEELARELTRKADQALYQAKHGGRNRVVVYGVEGSEFAEGKKVAKTIAVAAQAGQYDQKPPELKEAKSKLSEKQGD